MRLLVRADAGTSTGTGHLMRCLALAQEWQRRGGGVTFIGEITRALADRCRAEGCRVVETPVLPEDEDAAVTGAEAGRWRADWVVLDGYRFTGLFAAILRERGCRVLQVDDYGHSGHVHADLVLNQNLYADESLYPARDAHARLLLGPSYVLLRREFWPLRGRPHEIASCGRRVLVTLGGSDPENVTAGVMRGLQEHHDPELQVRLLIGAANPHRDQLEMLAGRDARLTVSINVPNMPELMACADVGVLSGSTTCWEAAFAGLPCVVIVCAEHQWGVARALDARGIARSLGWHRDLTERALGDAVARLLSDEHERATRAALGQQAIDGLGVERVCAAMGWS